MRILSVLLILTLLLAGCSSSDSSSNGKTTTTTTTSTGPPAPPPVTTDMLHLLDAPYLAAKLPSGGSEFSTPVGGQNFGGGGGGGGPSGRPEWSYAIQTPVNVSSGEIHIWIKITETLVQTPSFFPPGSQSCTWIARLELGLDNFVDVPCITEPAGPINAATKELVFSFTGTGLTQLEANETVVVSFQRNAFSASPNTPVYVLSGTEEHDSYVKINGLLEVVPAK